MQFPAEMLIDYVRVYQRKGSVNIGCDPPDYPTLDYINRHQDAYTSECWAFGSPCADVLMLDLLLPLPDPNLTSWTKQGAVGAPAGYSWPKNKLVRYTHAFVQEFIRLRMTPYSLTHVKDVSYPYCIVTPSLTFPASHTSLARSFFFRTRHSQHGHIFCRAHPS
jgi:hypothetical protein